MMQFEADRMTGLVLSDDNVRPELKVVLEEWNMRVGNSPDARLGEQVAASLYLNHPYGRPIIGWRHEIEKLDREDALAFYRRLHTPKKKTLLGSGAGTGRGVRKKGRGSNRERAPRGGDQTPPPPPCRGRGGARRG